jgi:hypothetical protein
LERHWDPATLRARRTILGLEATTENVTHCSFRLGSESPAGRTTTILIDGQKLTVNRPEEGRVYLARKGARWRAMQPGKDNDLRKRPGLQGPIDDAFLDRFLFVRPTGPPLRERVGDWILRELARSTNEWRAQFRGDVPIKDDIAVTEQDIASSHLILWGDPQSNRLLARMKGKLPLSWTPRKLEIGKRGFPADSGVPLLIYPNPLNPARYVVLNSGFTFWRAGNGSNAQQTPKLPDFAVIDVTVSFEVIPTRGVMSAGFFDERWQFPKE